MSICKNCKETNQSYHIRINNIIRCTTNRMDLHHSYNDRSAVQYEDGTEQWFKNDQLHRKNGPAWISRTDGEAWSVGFYKNGKAYRKHGPAFIGNNGLKCWYVNGVETKRQEFYSDCSAEIEEILSKDY